MLRILLFLSPFDQIVGKGAFVRRDDQAIAVFFLDTFFFNSKGLYSIVS